ncbi:2,3-bisphosphoglycerate-independent phosphoglycerate mutase [Candidatus Wolfebacteria bacterium]|nr:2,3-bisphosphoglycerate-independent phosphoglycerate mutase [Candidatus Wolfebacteria bacterium]
MSKRGVVLIILDGWGIGGSDDSNPIYVVNPETFNYLKANFPMGALQASGISVGLPWGEEGNSEVGHLNIGAGKVIYQHYPKITLSIKDGSFFQNEVFKKAFTHARENNSAVNIIGLLGEGNVHSSLEHLGALLDFAEKENFKNLNLHLFTDGRDSGPYSAFKLLSQVPKGLVASLCGRFYAMDRDNHWERTEKAYRVLTGDGPVIKEEEVESHIKEIYEKNLNDEYVEPVLIGPEKRNIKDGGSVIFFDFREDRMKQIISPFIFKDFKKFNAIAFNNLYVATMTSYDKDFNVPAAFLPDKAEDCLGKVLSENNKAQFRIAETQKYPHITYFFNNLREEPFRGEFRALVPSKSAMRPDDHPEMMAPEIANRVISAIGEGAYDFILANFANPDMIAHTGNYDACIQAVKVIDKEIERIVEACIKANAFLIITSDHGNMEKVFDSVTGVPQTKHDPNPVPIYLIAKEFARQKSEEEIRRAERKNIGMLADIAPTILEIMKIPQPKEMTGRSLLSLLVNN